jgi:DNA-directed RNA polymerase subunit H (RpoH/RPB5)
MEAGLEKLVNLRNRERVELMHGLVDDKSKTGYVTEQLLLRRDGAVLVLVNHSDDVVDAVMSEIDPRDSGYLFFASELRLNPLDNCMVPPHRTATAEEVQTLNDRRIPPGKLPVIRMLDPVRRWHGFPEGSIVAIDRPDGTYFRVVRPY